MGEFSRGLGILGRDALAQPLRVVRVLRDEHRQQPGVEIQPIAREQESARHIESIDCGEASMQILARGAWRRLSRVRDDAARVAAATS